MAGDEDLLERMRRHPAGWRYAELARILQRAGYREVSRRGSHRKWAHPTGPSVVLVDRPGDVLAAYVRKVVKAIGAGRRTGRADR